MNKEMMVAEMRRAGILESVIRDEERKLEEEKQTLRDAPIMAEFRRIYG